MCSCRTVFVAVLYTHASIYACLQKPEAKTGCLSWSFSTFFDRVSHWFNNNNIVWPESLRDAFSLPTLSNRHMSPCLVFMGAGIWTQVRPLVWQVLTEPLLVSQMSKIVSICCLFVYAEFWFKKCFRDVRQSPGMYFKGLLLYKLS